MKSINTLRMSLLALSLIAHQATAAVVNIAGTGQDFEYLGSATAAGDFNCDGYDDLVMGSPGEDAGVSNAGAINIVYGGTGSGGQIGTTNNVQLTEASFLEAQPDDGFGGVLAAGDYNGDGCYDMAVGIPGKDVGSAANAGTVLILYGHWRGAGQGGSEIWHQNTAGVDGAAEQNDYFGATLATGDFNGDGVDDLAIGVSGEDSGAGWVYVMHGQALAGITTAQDLFYSQGSEGISGGAESGDRFGGSLAAGDFNGDGYDDLVIGVPGEDWGDDLDNAGGAHVLYGSAGSLSGTGSQLWHQDAAGVEGVSGYYDGFGSSVAAGDFDGDGFADLAVGVPDEGWTSYPYPTGTYTCGVVNVLYGSSAGVTATGDHIIYSNNAPIAVGCNSDFGGALTAADFDGDGYKDLAIGAPTHYVNNVSTGSVQLVYGDVGGLRYEGSHNINQNLANVDGVNEWDDYFGKSLASGDFNADGRADLAVGAPRDINGGIEGGAVQVFYGAAGALNPANDQLFVQ